MKRFAVCIFLLFLALPSFLQSSETWLTVKHRIRVSDGIGRGSTRKEAVEAAVQNARKKAMERVATSFIHSYERVESFVLTEDRIIEDIHAEVLRQKVRQVEYPYENVALVTVDFTVRYFDLDFFVREMRKSSESSLMRSLVISGWGQIYNKNYFNAVLFLITTYGSFANAYYHDTRVTSLKKDYQNASTDTVEELYSRYKEAVGQRDLWLIVGVSSWIYSIWEAFEDREITNEKLDEVHDRYFPDFYYTRKKSFVQKAVDRWAPRW